MPGCPLRRLHAEHNAMTLGGASAQPTEHGGDPWRTIPRTSSQSRAASDIERDDDRSAESTPDHQEMGRDQLQLPGSSGGSWRSSAFALVPALALAIADPTVAAAVAVGVGVGGGAWPGGGKTARLHRTDAILSCLRVSVS